MVFSFLGSVLGGTSSSSSESCRPYLEKWATCGRRKSRSHLRTTSRRAMNLINYQLSEEKDEAAN